MNYGKLFDDLCEMVESGEFHVVFTKKNGKVRLLRCVVSTYDEHLMTKGLVNVYDMDAEQNKSVNLNTLKYLFIQDGTCYTIKEGEWVEA